VYRWRTSNLNWNNDGINTLFYFSVAYTQLGCGENWWGNWGISELRKMGKIILGHPEICAEAGTISELIYVTQPEFKYEIPFLRCWCSIHLELFSGDYFIIITTVDLPKNKALSKWNKLVPEVQTIAVCSVDALCT
jgi:hypothetical protein